MNWRKDAVSLEIWRSQRDTVKRQVRCTTASYLVASSEGAMQVKLDLRDWLRLADQVTKLAEPYIRRVIGDLE